MKIALIKSANASQLCGQRHYRSSNSWKFRSVRLLTLLLAPIVLLAACQKPQDRADSLSAADRVHSQLIKKDFHSIYREAGDSLKNSVHESKFVAHMTQLTDAIGGLEKATPIAYKSSFDTAGGAKHILMFDLEFDRGQAKESLVFVRSKRGQMQVWDLNIAPVE